MWFTIIRNIDRSEQGENDRGRGSGTGAEFNRHPACFLLRGLIIVYEFNHTLLLDQACYSNFSGRSWLLAPMVEIHRLLCIYQIFDLARPGNRDAMDETTAVDLQICTDNLKDDLIMLCGVLKKKA
jgi:hypothetical protein